MAENINELVSNLTKADICSALCTLLYELKDVPEYSTLSELYFILDKKSIDKLMTYYEGQTVRFPTKQEVAELTQVLRLFNNYEIEKMPWKEAVLAAGFDSSKGKAAKNKLDKLKKVIESYNYGNRKY